MTRYRKPSITIHYGASNDDISVNEMVFVRHQYSGEQRYQIRRDITQHLKRAGYFKAATA